MFYFKSVSNHGNNKEQKRQNNIFPLQKSLLLIHYSTYKFYSYYI